MSTFIFASSNQYKIDEILALSGGKLNIITAAEAGITEGIPETGSTLEENARIKARYIFERTGKDVFSDDSGLEVEALNGAPGVYSARYAGPEKDSEKNMDLLLQQLENASNRNACFKTIICMIKDGEEYIFEGRIDGIITTARTGNGGFGYDPIFLPNGSTQTFAEMGDEAKNAMSHRSRALRQLISFLNI